jgi:uncharacterized membrane protein
MGASATLRIEFVARGPESTEVLYHLNYQLPGGLIGALASKFGLQSLLDAQAKASVRSLRRVLLKVHRAAEATSRLETEESRSR